MRRVHYIDAIDISFEKPSQLLSDERRDNGLKNNWHRMFVARLRFAIMVGHRLRPDIGPNPTGNPI